MIYPEEAIDEAGLDQKPEDFLRTFSRATPSELCTHSLAVFPANGGGRALVYPSRRRTRTQETSAHATYHAFQAMSDVDRKLVPSIGATIIIANLPSGRRCSP